MPSAKILEPATVGVKQPDTSLQIFLPEGTYCHELFLLQGRFRRWRRHDDVDGPARAVERIVEFENHIHPLGRVEPCACTP